MLNVKRMDMEMRREHEHDLGCSAGRSLGSWAGPASAAQR